MLDMSQIETIRHLSSQGVSQTQIAQRLGVSRPTVRKYLRQEDFSPRPPVGKHRSSKLDPFKPVIDSIIERDRHEWRKQRHTAKRIHERLVTEYGYDGGYTIVQSYARQRKTRISDEGFLNLTWSPGFAQADFGEADFWERGSKERKYFLVLSFPYSNMAFFQVFSGTTAECVCQGLKDIFGHIGGVPVEIAFDDATGVGRRIADGLHETELFSRFRLYHGFSIRFCNPNSGHEKGNVENKVAWVRNNVFVPTPASDDVLVYNEELLAIADSHGATVHYRKEASWGFLFEEDRETMIALPETGFAVVRYEHRRADRYGDVTLDGCHTYSTSPALATKDVIVGYKAHTLQFVSASGELVAEHRRQYGRAKTQTTNPMSSLHLLRRRPGAWMNSEVRRSLPEKLRSWLDGQPKDMLTAYLRMLEDCAAQTDFDTAVESISVLVERGKAFSESDVKVLAWRLDTFGLDAKPDPGPELEVYDVQLLGRGA